MGLKYAFVTFTCALKLLRLNVGFVKGSDINLDKFKVMNNEDVYINYAPTYKTEVLW